MDQIKEKNKNTKIPVRPPIIVVMGHIDHGKTKILDWYRKTKVVEQESGGITQHIGAYEVEHRDKKIVFIDTPGHEAFSKIRSRGAKAADIAILVVAADEGVKPQTKEAIKIIQENELPLVAAINKIDKPGANVEKVKQELAQENILVESYGGKIPSVEISAKTGLNMDNLLEILLLVAELENLEANPEKPAEGVVIESHLDPQRGISSTLLIYDGTLQLGDILAIGKDIEAIKIMENFLGQSKETLGPSSPALVAGLSEMPQVGEKFAAFPSKKEAEEYIVSLPEEKLAAAAGSPSESIIINFNVVLKTDVTGSQEALGDSLRKLSNEKVAVNILRGGTGDINESDVQLALATKLITIIGFKVSIDPPARELAEKSGINVISADTIYELLDAAKKKIEEMLPGEIKRTFLGKAKVLKLFRAYGHKQIVGAKLEEGIAKRNVNAEIKRGGEIAGRGLVLELQREKTPVEEVAAGWEFGMLIDSAVAIQTGDIMEIFQEEIIKAAL